MVETKDEEDRRLPGLAELRPAAGGSASASEPRLYIRANFDEMTAARGRGVAWQQIAGLLDAAGVRGASGGALDWRQVKALFHAERYAREEAAKRAAGPTRKPRGRARRRRVAVAEAPAPSPSSPSALGPLVIAPEKPEQPPPPAPTSPPPPAAGGPFATGDPALDRALNSVRKLTPLPPMGTMDTQGRRKPAQEKQDDGEDG